MSYKTILLVDDDKSNIHILVDALGGEYKLIVAMDGESALQILGAETPDLILLDIMMPGLNGFEVLEFIKSSPATMNIPVIILSSRTGPQDLARGLELGASYYLTKPFEISDIKACIVSFLQRTENKAL